MREKIIFEASEKAREVINKGALSNSDLASIATTPIIPISRFFEKNTGVEVGREVGEPQAGVEYGREGAIGALARKDPNVTMRDVYTVKNVASRALHGAVPGALVGGAIGAIAGGSEGAAAGAAIGAGTAGAVNAAVRPAYNYIKGKLYGSPTVIVN